MSESEGQEFDLFISYSHADSKGIVQTLVKELEAMGLDVWYDDVEMSIGDSIRESIDRGQQTSKFGVVVLSESYFEGTSEWELNGLVNKHTKEGNVILPVWHGVGYDEVYKQSPSLADLKAETITQDNVQSVASTIYNVVVEDDEDASVWGNGEEGEGRPSFVDVDIRFEGRINVEIGTELTLKAWRNHHPPDFTQLEAVVVQDEDREIEYTSETKGTVMTVATIDDEPLTGVVSDIDTVRPNKTEFTVRLDQSRINELSDDSDDYKSGLVR